MPEETRTEGGGRGDAVRRIRDIIGLTQAQLGKTLTVSAKAVQSYEQGWREVPDRVLVQLLILLALYRRQSMDDVPCWEVRRCSAAARERCSAFAIGRGQFCWFVGSKECAPACAQGESSGLACLECPVVQRVLRGPVHYEADGGAAVPERTAEGG